MVDRWLSVDEIVAYLGIKRDTIQVDRRKTDAGAQAEPILEISERGSR